MEGEIVNTAQKLAKFRDECRKYFEAQRNNNPLAARPSIEQFGNGPGLVMARMIWDEEYAKRKLHV